MSQDSSDSSNLKADVGWMREYWPRPASSDPPPAAAGSAPGPDRPAPNPDNDPTLVLSTSKSEAPCEHPPDGPARPTATHPERLGDYRIVRELGRGGMGVVYEAFQESLRRRVALKVLSNSLSTDPVLVRRFEREARAAGGLHHTNIIPVFGVGQHEHYHYYVMQLIDGPSLNLVIREIRAHFHRPNQPHLDEPDHGGACDRSVTEVAQSFLSARTRETPSAVSSLVDSDATTLTASPQRWLASPSPDTRENVPLTASTGSESTGPRYSQWEYYARRVAMLGKQAAEALAYAHDHGVLHRDIKPANLLLDDRESVWLTDFGLAKVKNDPDLTDPGNVVGTLRYLPPERLKESKEEKEATQQSDQYSLGLTLYEMLALRQAFEESDRARLIGKIVNERPEPLSTASPQTPRDLITIVSKAMEPDPDARYPSAASLAADLDNFLNNRPIVARPMSPVERLVRWCRRNPALARLSFSLAGTLLLGAIVSTIVAINYRYLVGRLERTLGERKQYEHRLEATLAAACGSVASKAGEARDFQTALLWSSVGAIKSLNCPELIDAATARVRLWSRLVPRPETAFSLLTSKAHATGSRQSLQIAFDHSGKFLLDVTAEPSVRIWDLKSEALLELPTDLGTPRNAVWNSAGTQLAIVTKSAVTVYRFPELERIVSYPLKSPVPVPWLGFSAPGDLLAVTTRGSVMLYPTSEDRLGTEPIEIADPDGVLYMAWGAKGRRLASIDGKHRASVYEIDPASRQVTSLLDDEPSIVYESDWLTSLAFLNNDQTLVLPIDRWTFKTFQLGTRETPVATRTSDRLLWISANPDGKSFTIVETSRAQAWDSTTLKPIGRPSQHDNYVYRTVHRPDGEAYLTLSSVRTVGYWKMKTGEAVTSPLPHEADVTNAAFAPDGRRFATAQADGFIRIWAFDAEESAPIKIKGSYGDAFAVLSSDRSMLVPAGFNHARSARSTRVYDARNGRPLGPVLRLDGYLNGAAFSNDGSRVVTIASGTDGTPPADWGERISQHSGKLQVWDWRTGTPVFPPVWTPSEPLGVDFHPDGSRLAVSCSGGQVLVIDAATGAVIESTDQNLNTRLGFLIRGWLRYAPNGRHFLTWGQSLIRGNKFDYPVSIWDGSTGKLQKALDLDELCHRVVFSPDGTQALTALSSGHLSRWNIETGQEIGKPFQQTDWIFDAAFSPDQSTIATAGRDRNAYQWNVQRETAGYPMSHIGEVLGVTYSKDGRWLFTATKGVRDSAIPGKRQSTIEVWDASTGEWLGLLGMTHAEVSQVELDATGDHLIVSGSRDGIFIYALKELFARSPGPQALERMHMEAELISGQALVAVTDQNSQAHNLTSTAWIEKWAEYKKVRGESGLSTSQGER